MKLAALAVLAFSLTSCATVVTGTKDNVSFLSNPEGATVTVAGRVLGKTPVTVALPKKTGQAIMFEKDGYKPLSMELETQMNGWFWGNLVIGGLLGSTTDGASGAIYKYSPSQYMVTLEPLTTTMGIEKGPGLSNQQRIREFVVMSYPQLIQDVRAGSGEYLSSLMTLLNIPDAERGDLAKQLTVISASHTTIPDFADKVSLLARAQ